MDVSLAIRQRLEELGLEQRDLARAARVTESYVSQLLTRNLTPVIYTYMAALGHSRRVTAGTTAICNAVLLPSC